MNFSHLASATGSSVSDVARGPRSVSVVFLFFVFFEKFCVTDQNKKFSDLVTHSLYAIFDVLA